MFQQVFTGKHRWNLGQCFACRCSGGHYRPACLFALVAQVYAQWRVGRDPLTLDLIGRFCTGKTEEGIFAVVWQLAAQAWEGFVRLDDDPANGLARVVRMSLDEDG